MGPRKHEFTPSERRKNRRPHVLSGLAHDLDVTSIVVHVASRLVLESCPKDLRRQLVSDFSHTNPAIAAARRGNRSTWGIPATIQTWREDDAVMSLPRGGTGRLRAACKRLGYRIEWRDERVQLPSVEFPQFRLNLRDYQRGAVDACLRHEQGLIKAGTGSGKTVSALAFIAEAKQPAIVIMRDSNLLKQWAERVVSQMGMPKRQIGMLVGGKRKVGSRITLALQQTLYAESFPLDDIIPLFGVVLVDECQGVAARCMTQVVDRFPARYRIGVSADHTRKDHMEFITHDLMGSVIHETARRDLEGSGAIVPVQVHAIGTGFTDAAWMAGDREMTRIQSLMAEDAERNALVLSAVERLLAVKESPILVFVHRREHAKWLADTLLFDAGIKCGLLLGSDADATRFAEDRERLETGDLQVAVGTYNAIGQGIDIPLVRSAVVATPIGDNRQFFGQVRGRVCRPSAGKRVGHLVYLWDHHLFHRQLGRIHEWSDGRCVETTVERLLAG